MGIWKKCENLEIDTTPRNYKVKFMDGTILNRNTKLLRLVKNENIRENNNEKNSENVNQYERGKKIIETTKRFKNYV